MRDTDIRILIAKAQAQNEYLSMAVERGASTYSGGVLLSAQDVEDIRGSLDNQRDLLKAAKEKMDAFWESLSHPT